jgi:hypothetical protein
MYAGVKMSVYLHFRHDHDCAICYWWMKICLRLAIHISAEWLITVQLHNQLECDVTIHMTMNMTDGSVYKSGYRSTECVNQILNEQSTHLDNHSRLPQLQRLLHYEQSHANMWHFGEISRAFD